MSEQFIRSEMMLGQAGMQALHRAHVAVFGVGGVGSWCIEALARGGVGQLTLVDFDTISESNLNRQIEALHSTIGQGKAQSMKNRIRDIHPACQVTVLEAKYDAEHRDDFFTAEYDYIVDAIDLVSCKLDLIETALARQIPIISALGTGNKLDASQFQVSDIAKTTGCPLARILRKELGKRGIRHHKVVFSPELPQECKHDTGEVPPSGRRSIPASVPWVPPVAGFLLAGAVMQDIAFSE